MANSNYYWILDPGHGGIIDGTYQTKGKRSPVWPDGRQLFEGEFNRDVVHRLSQLLVQHGIEHEILVPTEQDVPLSTRKNKANEIYASDKRSILVSVHANAGGGTGWEVFTSPGETKSDVIAQIFYEHAAKDFAEFKMRTDRSDGDADKEAHFYIIEKTKCPAILTENFFFDTLDPDCELLMSDEGRQRIAEMHFKAIQQIERDQPI